jgi:integrase
LKVAKLLRQQRAKTRAQNEGQSREESAAAREEQWRNKWLKETLQAYKKAKVAGKIDIRTNTLTMIKIGGDVKLGEIDECWVEDYIAAGQRCESQRGRLFKISSISAHLMGISAAMKWQAKQLGAKGEKLPLKSSMFPAGWDDGRERRISADEESRILQHFASKPWASSKHYLGLFKLALETAARLQELVLAEWSEFSLEGRHWIIPANHCKTRKSRIVPLSSQAIRCLEEMRLLKSHESPRVFHAISSPHMASMRFRLNLLRLGIVGLTFHDARHEAVSRMVLTQRNLTVFEIMGIVGHSSLKMLKRYANLRPSELVDKWLG